MAGNRTRVNCLEGSYAHHYTTNAWCNNWAKSWINFFACVRDILFSWRSFKGALHDATKVQHMCWPFPYLWSSCPVWGPQRAAPSPSPSPSRCRAAASTSTATTSSSESRPPATLKKARLTTCGSLEAVQRDVLLQLVYYFYFYYYYSIVRVRQ